MTTFLNTTCTAIGAAMIATAAAADGHAQAWDMPMAYAATNFHSEQGVIFADKVREYTDGAIDITVHAGGSLFNGGDIKRAVQTGQVPIVSALCLHTRTRHRFLAGITCHLLPRPTKTTNDCGRLHATQ